MELQHVAAATDGSSAGHHAVVVAARLAAQAEASLTVLTVRVVTGAELHERTTTEGQGVRLERDLAAAFAGPLAREAPGVVPEFVQLAGVPGIEIPRFAEENGVDLLVLGRPHRTHSQRVFIGDTADAVARRSQVPCLLVAPETESLEPMLACLDATERSEAVSRTVADFARIAGSRLHAVTVEPVWMNEPEELAAALPASRSLRLDASLSRGDTPAELHVRRGSVVPELVAEATAVGAAVVAFGYRRGGPPGIMEGGSVARGLMHAAPGAVLTVPL